MASFCRQLSHGSDTENPQSFEQALQPPPPLPPQQKVSLDCYEGPQLKIQQIRSPTTLQSQNSFTPGAQEMDAAYKISNMIVRERMEQENPEDVKILDSVNESDIVCVRGTYDHIHLVLQAIQVPFAHVSPHRLMKIELKPEQTVYINCPSRFPVNAAKKLSAFVEAGGMLITTDWALKSVIEVAFPNTVKFNGKATGDEVVSVEIVEMDDDVLKGFIDQEKDAAPVWWLERSSYPIEVLDKKKVKVLVRSAELKKKYGADPVIISFEWGKGIVYHMISHFYLQRSETRTDKQSTGASEYAKYQNVSAKTVSMFEEMEQATPNLNYGVVQSAATSSEFVSRALVKQKKRNKS